MSTIKWFDLYPEFKMDYVLFCKINDLDPYECSIEKAMIWVSWRDAQWQLFRKDMLLAQESPGEQEFNWWLERKFKQELKNIYQNGA